MIELTKAQREALQGEETPPRIRDPEANTTYVLVPEELFARLQGLLAADDEDPAVRYPAFAQAAWEEWDDPALDVYEQYRKTP